MTGPGDKKVSKIIESNEMLSQQKRNSTKFTPKSMEGTLGIEPIDQGVKNVQMLDRIGREQHIFGMGGMPSSKDSSQEDLKKLPLEEVEEKLVASLVAFHREAGWTLPKGYDEIQTDVPQQTKDQELLKAKCKQETKATDEQLEIGMPLIEKYSDDKTSEEQKIELMHTIRSFMMMGGNAEQTDRYLAALKGEILGLAKKTVEERENLTTEQQYCEDWVDRTIDKASTWETPLKPYRSTDTPQRPSSGAEASPGEQILSKEQTSEYQKEESSDDFIEVNIRPYKSHMRPSKLSASPLARIKQELASEEHHKKKREREREQNAKVERTTKIRKEQED